jgi:hypothetical protein
MSPRIVIVIQESPYVPVQGGFVEDDHVVQTLSPDGANHLFRVRTLPWGPHREHLLDSHRFHIPAKLAAEKAVAVSKQVWRDLVQRERLSQLLRRPFRSGVRCDIEVDDPTAVVRQHQKHVQHMEPDCRHGEKVD